MAQQTAIKPYNTFVKGIITEAGPLTFPENASLDEENMVLNRDGSRQRRLGMDLEQDYALHQVNPLSTDAVTAHRWKNVANDPKRQFVVIQVGNRLLVFDANPASTSAHLLATLNASAYLQGPFEIQTANALGYLLITATGSDPLYLSYNPGTGVISISQVFLSVRDFWGCQDNLPVEARPATLSNEHYYNLLNQGWTGALANQYKVASGFYPSNAQQWTLGKDPDDVFDPALLDKQDFGTSSAPRGRYIISPFLRSASRNAQTDAAVPSDIDNTRPSTVAFAFRRAFYSGCQSEQPLPTETSPDLTGYVFYTRTVRSQADLGRCYQDADPTSEVDSELVDTDGGYITIPDSGKIYKLLAKGSALIVFAENGVWAIMGDDGGFRATVNQVVKVSDFGVIGPGSVVDAEDSAMYWNRGGIYLLSSEDGVSFTATNITQNTIQTLFNAIPSTAKSLARGSFDPVNRQIRWMYNLEESYDGVNFRNKYTNELVLDMVLSSFVKNSISNIGDPSPYIAGYVDMPDPLLPKEGVRNRGTTVTKYLVVQYINPSLGQAAVSFSYYRDEGFRDWRAIDGVGTSFSSYCVTGYEIAGDTMRNKRVDYITCHFKLTELNATRIGGVLQADNPSGCMVQARWGWANHPNSGKWGEPFQAYRLPRPFVLPAEGEPIDYGYEVVSSKSRLPGSGPALSLLFQSEENKDFYMYGWSIKISGAPSV